MGGGRETQGKLKVTTESRNEAMLLASLISLEGVGRLVRGCGLYSQTDMTLITVDFSLTEFNNLNYLS